jgi:hypothetical protein
MALSKLFITDFDRLKERFVDKDEKCCDATPLSEDTAYERMLANGLVMTSHGANCDGVNPINMVSGFTSQDADLTTFPDLKTPSELSPGGMKGLKFLMWGSPHPRASSDESKCHGCSSISAEYKTNAFESMAWLAPMGSVFMMFLSKFRVELYQPRHHPDATSRLLMCGKMFSRNYIPMASGNGMRFTIPDADIQEVMVAMLLIPEHIQHLTMVGENIDFGTTALKIIRSLAGVEFGVALGVYDLSLEMELVHAMAPVDDQVVDRCNPCAAES